MTHNPNALVEARDRMMRNLSAKLDKQMGHRGDLYVADFQAIDRDGGRMLLGYEKTIGPISGNDVVAFVARYFNGEVRPLMETAKQHRAEGAVSLVVHRTVPTRKVEDKAEMLCVSATHFLDQQLGDTWEVKSQNDGTPFLARVSRDDINTIVQERRSRMSVKASTVTFSNALSAGVPNLSVGDTVRYYRDGRVDEGKITQVSDIDVAIKGEAGSFTVAPEAVTEILQTSPETDEKVKSYLEDYFADAYGFEGYAKELTRDLT